MEFTFTDEQDQLRATARDFLTRSADRAYTRAMLDDDRGFTPEVWAQVVEMGWTGVLVPEALGGLGLGMVDLLPILEEMGRVPFAGPFLSSTVAATRAAVLLGLDDRAAALAAGTVRGAIALDESGHGDVVDRVRCRASRKTGHWVLDGQKPVVVDGHTANFVLVAARTQEGLGTFVLEGDDLAGRVEPVPTWDLSRKVARLDVRGLRAQPVGPDGDHTAIWRRVADDTSVALCAELIGSMEAAQVSSRAAARPWSPSFVR